MTIPLIDAFVQDVRLALRRLTQERGFALTAVLVLGAGIGVNNMMLTLVYSATLRGLPIDRPDRVLYISTFDDTSPDRPLSYAELEDLRAASSLSGLAAYITQPAAVSDPGRAPERVEATYVTAGAMALVGTAPIAGRSFDPSDDASNAPPIAILGGGLWRTRYDRDPDVIGRSILVDGRHATVIGIMPEPSRFPSSAEIWLPLAHAPGINRNRRDSRSLRVIARVRDDIALSDARAEIETIVARAADAHPESSRGLKARAVSIHDRFFGPVTQPTWLAFATVSLLIVLVSSANAANLMLTRAAAHAREMAIRGSLGASRGRVVAQLFTEGVVLAAAAMVVGLAVARGAVGWFRASIPVNAMPYWFEFSMDGTVFAALGVVTCLTLLIFGLVPALKASRVDVTRVDAERSGTGSGSTHRLTAGFLTAQFALSVILLAQVVVSSQRPEGSASDRIVETTAVVTASFTLAPPKYATNESKAAFSQQLLERVRAESGVNHATVASAPPLGGGTPRRLEAEGWQSRDEAPTVLMVGVSSDYFATLAVPVVRGREFDDRDGQPGLEHAIVNRRLAALYFPGQDPIGRRLRLISPDATAPSWLTIVGLADDIRQRATTADPEPIVYVPWRADAPATTFVLVRSSLDPATATDLLRRAAMTVDSGLPLYRTTSLRQFVRDAQWNGRVSHQMIVMLTMLALGLALVGLYAVMSHTVTERTREIGLRMAIGASPEDVRRLILSRAAWQVSIGLVAGVAGSVIWDAVFFSGRPDARLTAWDVLLPVAGVLAATTAAACWLPLRRATRLDPSAALRQE